MTEQIRLWSIGEGDQLNAISQTQLDFEDRLEIWLEQDISILSNDLLVIGKQVPTEYGGWIDILCLDSQGNLVVLELKRHKTPREVVAQALDYASWVASLSNDSIVEIASRRYSQSDSGLEEAFMEQFGSELPETLNTQHRIIIVASEIDSSTQRIIQYLANTHGIGITAATFSYFKNADSNQEIIARTFLIEPEEIEQIVAPRTTNRTSSELDEIALSHSEEVYTTFRYLRHQLAPQYFWWSARRSSIVFNSKGKNRKTLLSINAVNSSAEDGLEFQVYTDRLAEYLGIEVAKLLDWLPAHEIISQSDWSGTICKGFFKSQQEAESFVAQLHESQAGA